MAFRVCIFKIDLHHVERFASSFIEQQDRIIDFNKWHFYLLNMGYQENSHLSKSSLVNSPRKIPTRNIPTHVFKHFVFSLLSPLSLILLKRLFCISVLTLNRSHVVTLRTLRSLYINGLEEVCAHLPEILIGMKLKYMECPHME